MNQQANESVEIPYADTREQDDSPPDNLALAANLLAQAEEVGAGFVNLLELELKLALGDALRIVVLSRLYVYLIVLAWLGLSVCVAWTVYDISGYGPVSALVFFLLQIVGLWVVQFLVRKFSDSLSLPRTRAQFRALFGGDDASTQATAK